MIYLEVFDRIDEAFQREKQIQGWSRKKKEALMMSDFNQLHEMTEYEAYKDSGVEWLGSLPETWESVANKHIFKVKKVHSDRSGIVSPAYGVYRQKNDNTFNPKYLEFLLKTTKYIEHYNKVSSGLHSSRLRFYGHTFFGMKLGFPSYEEQNKIIIFLDEQLSKIESVITTEAQQIQKLKEYKATLINSAVTGKIKITPEMAEPAHA